MQATLHVAQATCYVCLQAAYATHLAKDENGAIAAFLDDPGRRLLQVSVAKAAGGQLQLRLANSADFPQGCFYQVCTPLSQGSSWARLAPAALSLLRLCPPLPAHTWMAAADADESTPWSAARG